MAAVTSPARHAASLATSASNRERRQSKVHRAMEWPKPLSVRSSVTTSASVRARMHRPSSTSYQLGLITTTRFTPTRHSDIVHPVSSSHLTEVRDRVRSFGGYNTSGVASRVKFVFSTDQPNRLYDNLVAVAPFIGAMAVFFLRWRHSFQGRNGPVQQFRKVRARWGKFACAVA